MIPASQSVRTVTKPAMMYGLGMVRLRRADTSSALLLGRPVSIEALPERAAHVHVELPCDPAAERERGQHQGAERETESHRILPVGGNRLRCLRPESRCRS